MKQNREMLSVHDRTQEYLAFVVSCIRKQLPHCSIYLFGSRAQNSAHEGSDLDIALDNNSKIDRSFIVKINNELEESSLPIFVDVVDLHSVGTLLREQILTHGILWTK